MDHCIYLYFLYIFSNLFQTLPIFIYICNYDSLASLLRNFQNISCNTHDMFIKDIYKYSNTFLSLCIYYCISRHTMTVLVSFVEWICSQQTYPLVLLDNWQDVCLRVSVSVSIERLKLLARRESYRRRD